MNAAMYCFDIQDLLASLDELSNDNNQGEYYLTDVIGILKNKGKRVGAVVTDYEDTIGVNSRAQLAEAEEILRNRINRKHLDNGVTLIDPKTTYIGVDVKIGKDTIIYPNNILEGNTEIEEGCTLLQNNRIKDSHIESGVEIQSSVILDSKVGENTTVGLNYDGKDKHKTIIGNHSFIGCNTNLVSPVEVEDNTYIAAGSTITNKVKEGDLAIARAKQTNISGWVKKKGLIK